MAKYEYTVTLDGNRVFGDSKKELIIEKDDGSIAIRLTGEVGSIVRFWPDGEVCIYKERAIADGFKPSLR